MVLQGLIQLYEEGTVAGDADEQVPVLARLFLGLSKGVGTYYIELYMHALHRAHGPNQRYQVSNPFAVIECVGMKLQVEQGPVGNDHMIHFGYGFDDCGGAFDIASRSGRDPVRKGLPAPVTPGQGRHSAS